MISPARLTRKKKKRQITNIRNKIDDVTTDSIAIKRVVREYYEYIYRQLIFLFEKGTKAMGTFYEMIYNMPYKIIA